MCLDDSLLFSYINSNVDRYVGALRHLVGEVLNQFLARAQLNLIEWKPLALASLALSGYGLDGRRCPPV